MHSMGGIAVVVQWSSFHVSFGSVIVSSLSGDRGMPNVSNLWWGQRPKGFLSNTSCEYHYPQEAPIGPVKNLTNLLVNWYCCREIRLRRFVRLRSRLVGFSQQISRKLVDFFTQKRQQYLFTRGNKGLTKKCHDEKHKPWKINGWNLQPSPMKRNWLCATCYTPAGCVYAMFEASFNCLRLVDGFQFLLISSATVEDDVFWQVCFRCVKTKTAPTSGFLSHCMKHPTGST